MLLKQSSLDENLPPIRSVLHRKKLKAVDSKKSDKMINGEKAECVQSFYHEASDKLALSKTLKEVDKSESEESESESDADEEVENERRLRLSEVKKDEGNKLFKEGKYEEAVEKYTAAISFASENPLFYTNRAIALYKLGRYASSESDCSTALNINPKLVKGLFR
ncbi:unnamed protein product [Rodentolepis nana]|uniref:TPR_REGION domain-containing protein n=1 Tax=Rodentolepis nana TaxID=102285 RepID=A0A0R3TAU7_RODNA|nr:unnamed protein product [Rodentolepis nana]